MVEYGRHRRSRRGRRWARRGGGGRERGRMERADLTIILLSRSRGFARAHPNRPGACPTVAQHSPRHAGLLLLLSHPSAYSITTLHLILSCSQNNAETVPARSRIDLLARAFLVLAGRCLATRRRLRTPRYQVASVVLLKPPRRNNEDTAKCVRSKVALSQYTQRLLQPSSAPHRDCNVCSRRCCAIRFALGH